MQFLYIKTLGEACLAQQQEKRQLKHPRGPFGQSGIFTFRGKETRLKKIVISQLAIIVLWTISLIVYFGNIPGFGEDATLVGLLPIIIIQIIFSMLVRRYLFTPKERSCFGKSNFSIRCLVGTDVEGV